MIFHCSSLQPFLLPLPPTPASLPLPLSVCIHLQQSPTKSQTQANRSQSTFPSWRCVYTISQEITWLFWFLHMYVYYMYIGISLIWSQWYSCHHHCFIFASLFFNPWNHDACLLSRVGIKASTVYIHTYVYMQGLITFSSNALVFCVCSNTYTILRWVS